MAAQSTEQAIGTHQLRGSTADRFLDQSAGTLSTILHRLWWNISWTQHDTGLLHKLGVLTNNVAYPGIIDLLKRMDVLRSLDKGGSIAAHVTYHDLDSCLVASFDDRLGILACQAHGFLNQDMLAMLNGGQGSIGVIFIAIQHEDRVEIALSGHIGIVGIAVFGRHVIAFSQGAEQFLRDITDGRNLKLI